MAAWSILWKPGVKPHRFIDTRALGDRVAGSRPSLRQSRRRPWRSPGAAGRRQEIPVGSDPADAPRVTGEKPTTASARR